MVARRRGFGREIVRASKKISTRTVNALAFRNRFALSFADGAPGESHHRAVTEVLRRVLSHQANSRWSDSHLPVFNRRTLLRDVVRDGARDPNHRLHQSVVRMKKNGTRVTYQRTLTL